MKNIHILPTDNKYSRLYFNINDKEYQICENEKTSTILKPNRHIYITNDEEIKARDWFITKEEMFKCTLVNEFIWRNNFDKFPSMKIDCKKIILTTDQDLIKHGVQKIDDEFLEWFVKNPSCESVETKLVEFEVDMGLGDSCIEYGSYYKIIIPSSEIWKDIPEFEGYYQVSNLGNIRSLNYGKIRELKPRLVGYDGNQYLAVNLSKDSEVKSIKVHKLVALCFLNHISKGYNGLVIDHIDSNKLNNRLDNLKLVTPRFNASKDKQGSSSKFTGVTWHKKSKKWQCQIYDNGKLNHLGLFNTEIEASETYNNYLENMTKEEPKQRLEKYSERFDNDKSAIGNPETWGKRMVEEPKQESFVERMKPLQEQWQQDMDKELMKQETTLEYKLKSLVEEWHKRQEHYVDVAYKYVDDAHNNRKFTYKAMATRDCWKELLKLIEDEK